MTAEYFLLKLKNGCFLKLAQDYLVPSATTTTAMHLLIFLVVVRTRSLSLPLSLYFSYLCYNARLDFQVT